MSIKHFATAALASALLVSCSSKDSDDSDAFFVGGLICASNGDSTVGGSADAGATTAAGETDSGSNAGLENNGETDGQSSEVMEATIDCQAPLNKSLPGPGSAKTGIGSITYNNSRFSLTGAAVTSDSEFVADGPANLSLHLHNGEMRSKTISETINVTNGTEENVRTDWGIYNANIAFFVDLYQAGTDTFTGGSFTVRPFDDANEAVTSNVADLGALLVDTNLDKTINLDSEVIVAVSGNVNVTGEAPNWSVTFDVTLKNGRTITGGYDGDFAPIIVE